jgi:tetratricopeptide (TPR) repeat protein
LKRLGLLIFTLFNLLSLSAQSLDTDSLKRVLLLSEGVNRLFILNELGTNLREKEQDLALEYLFEAEEIAIAQSDRKAESKSKENISWIYYRRGNWQLSFKYGEAAYLLALETSSYIEAAKVLNNIGTLHSELHNYETASLKFKEAYKLSLKENDLYTQIRSLNNIAFNFIQLGELDSAMTYAVNANRVNVKAESPYLTSFTYRVIADVFLKEINWIPRR